MTNNDKVVATVACDGAASPNPGRGAWCALVFCNQREYQLSGTEDATTNNRMEMTAALNGIKKAVFAGANSIEIVSDSQYLVTGIMRRLEKFTFYPRHSRGQTPNSDLWYELLDLVIGLDTKWTWVKGHATTKNNNRCDDICRELLGRHYRTSP